MSKIDFKKYVGIIGDSLAGVWMGIRAERETHPESSPPVGKKDESPTPGLGAVAGIPIGTLLLIGAAWYFLRGR